MVSFENTEIAFRSKSNHSLKKAYWLFKIIGNPKLVKFGKCATNTSLKMGLPIKGLIKKTIFAQFCGGETITECSKTIDLLAKYRIGTILDYSIEGKTSDEDFDATTAEIVRTIDAAKDNQSIPFAVFKVTGIARFGLLEKANASSSELNDKESKELNDVTNRINRICEAAFQANVSVFIDAEESWIQDLIDRICFDMMLKYNKERAIVFNTIQIYRHDRLEFLKQEILRSKTNGIHYGVKLVRGAYMEKERERALKNGYVSPIQPNKSACDTDFNAALKIILDNIDHVAVCSGSHNEESAQLLTKLMDEKGLKSDDKRVYFAQLLGMSDHISYNLANSGFNVAKYVPYGPVKEVMPYLLRRADENTSVAGQTSRELSLIMKERKRRASM